MIVMTTKEAAALLRCNHKKLTENVVAWGVPHKRIGVGPKARFKWIKEEIEKWLCKELPDVDPRTINFGRRNRMKD